MTSSSANFGSRAAASLETPQRKSTSATPRTTRQLKFPAADSDAISSPNRTSKTPKDRSPKVPQGRPLRNPVTEKKHPSRVSEVETKVAQLQEDLKRAKAQLNSAESCKRQAQQEAEHTKKQLLAMSAKVEDCQQQLMELTDCDDTRIEELRKISHDRDRVWQSEVEAIQKQHSIDSAALSTAMNEIKRLKNQLQIVSESEATQMQHAESAHEELQRLRMELTETLSLVESMKCELSDCRSSEAESKSLNQLKDEVKSLKCDLEASEARYQEEYIQSTLQIRSAYEQLEKTKLEASQKEAEMQAQLRTAKALIDELNEARRSKDEKSDAEVKKLKASILERDDEVKNLSEQNATLEMKIKKGQEEKSGANQEALIMAEAAKKLERAEAVNVEMEGELRRLKVQADQWRKAAEAAAAMLSNGNNDGKFVGRRGSLDENINIKYTTIGGALDSPFSEDMDYDEEDDDDDDDESLKKRNGNVLKKIGVLWRKGHK